MQEMKITVVGLDLLRDILPILEQNGLSPINRTEGGMLGNFKTYTLVYDISTDEVIQKRREIMASLLPMKDYLSPMYLATDWMHIFVFKNSAFKTRP